MQLLVAGGDCLTGHDPETGAELWRGYGLNRKHGEFMRLVPSPVSVAGLAIACGPKKEQMIAFRTDLTGDITEKGVAWTFDEKRTPDVCTPVVYEGKFFALDGDSQTLFRFDPKTGKKIWQGSLGDRTVVRSSPTAADGKIYIINERNTVTLSQRRRHVSDSLDYSDGRRGRNPRLNRGRRQESLYSHTHHPLLRRTLNAGVHFSVK